MATYDYRIETGAHGVNLGTGGFAAMDSIKFFVVKRVLDFALISAYRAANGLAALVAADVLQLWAIPAKCMVFGGVVNVVTAHGSAATVSLGDGAGATQYVNAGSINAVAALTAASTSLKFYTAADNLLLTLASGTYTVAGTQIAKIEVSLAVADYRPEQTVSRNAY